MSTISASPQHTTLPLSWRRARDAAPSSLPEPSLAGASNLAASLSLFGESDPEWLSLSASLRARDRAALESSIAHAAHEPHDRWVKDLLASGVYAYVHVLLVCVVYMSMRMCMCMCMCMCMFFLCVCVSCHVMEPCVYVYAHALTHTFNDTHKYKVASKP